MAWSTGLTAAMRQAIAHGSAPNKRAPAARLAGFTGDARRSWCCRKGLNFRTPPCQGGALPLSYGSRDDLRPGRVATTRRNNAPILAIRQQRAQPSPMTERPREPANRPGREPKAARLSAALRENLKRRKAQAKGRQGSRQQGGDDGREQSRPTELMKILTIPRDLAKTSKK